MPTTSPRVKMEDDTSSHKSTMDRMYHVQRHFYDVTRHYYLLGRDKLIADLKPPPGGSVLEIGCGTGRNIVAAAQCYPDATLYGFDISDAMLINANNAIMRHGLSQRVHIAQADATNVTPETIFGIKQFDRIYFSYTLSMIPDWQAAIRRATDMLAPGGELHIVDFGQSEELPHICKTVLFAWLKRFHVSPRHDMPNFLKAEAARCGGTMHQQRLYRGYAWYLRLLKS